MPGFTLQTKNENGEVVDIPVAAQYDNLGREITETYAAKDVEADVKTAVKYTPQTLTETQKSQIRENIGVTLEEGDTITGVRYLSSTVEGGYTISVVELTHLSGDPITFTIKTKNGLDGSGELAGDISATAGAHNTTFRGKDISEYLTDGSLYDRIQGKNGYELFEDLFVGDYFIGTINGEQRQLRIAGFDLYYGKGMYQTEIDEIYRHHVVVVPDNIVGKAQMEETFTTANGYAGSKLNRETLPEIDAQLEQIFGEHLLTWGHFFTDNVDNDIPSLLGIGMTMAGASCNINPYFKKSFLMSLTEVTGVALGSSPLDYMYQHNQYPLFKLAPEYQNVVDPESEAPDNRWYFWTSTVAFDGCFISIDGYDYFYDYFASNSHSGVRPACLIG